MAEKAGEQHNEQDAIEQPVDPTAEEAQRAASALNSAPEEGDPGGPPKEESEKAEDPRDAIARGYSKRQREKAREWTGRMTDPNVTAGPGPVAKSLEDPDLPITSPVVDLVDEQPPPPRMMKVKVDGREIEVPEDQVRATYQKNVSADLRLQEAERIKQEAIEFAKRVHQGQQPAPSNAETRAPTAYQQPTAQRQQAPTDQLAGFTAEELADAVNKIQVGSAEEAAAALADTLNRFGKRVAAPQQQPVDVAETVRNQLANEREVEKSSGALNQFVERYPNVVRKPELQLLLTGLTEQEMAKDFLSAGLAPQEISQLGTSGRLRLAHRYLRNHPDTRQFARDPGRILADIEKSDSFRAIAPLMRDKAPLSVNMDPNRAQRKEQVQPQPAQRTVPPRPAPQMNSQGDRHALAAAKLRQGRGQLVVN